MNGKGDRRRPMNVSQENFATNWEKAFKSNPSPHTAYRQLREVPEHDNPLEGGVQQLWEHHCSFNGRHMVQVGHPCNWCGEYEDGTID